jgi:hypothetical protein
MLMFNEIAILPLPRARARPQYMHVREAGAYRSYSLLPSVVSLFRFVSFLINGLCVQGLVKVIPGTPEGRKPIHEVENPALKRMQK